MTNLDWSENELLDLLRFVFTLPDLFEIFSFDFSEKLKNVIDGKKISKECGIQVRFQIF